MAARPRVLIVGGYGTFGSLLARELVTLPLDIVIGGRDEAKAQTAASALGCAWARVDLGEPNTLAVAARDAFAVVCAAGPFDRIDHSAIGVAAVAGAHWLDIADEPGWILAPPPSTRTAVLRGLSSTPVVSSALARWCAARVNEPARAQIVLSIGNRNVKGTASIASVLRGGFGEPIAVEVPDGRRLAYPFPSADAALLGMEVEFLVALEWRVAAEAARALGRLGVRAAGAIATLAKPLSRFGSPGGSVQAAVTGRDGSRAAAALSFDDQRLAIVPCAIALEELVAGRGSATDASHLLEPDDWIVRLRARGGRFFTRR